MDYFPVSYAQFEALIEKEIQEAKERILPQKSFNNVYDLLFDGLDVTVINLFCTQVTWSTQLHKKDRLLNALLGYSAKITDVFPLINQQVKDISDISQNTYDNFSKAVDTYMSGGDCLPYYNAIKQCIDMLDSKRSMDTTLIDKLTEVSNFVDSDLLPAWKDKSGWNDPGLEQCLTNDKFMNGTAASMRNLSLLLQFTTNNIKVSSEIISKIGSGRPDIIAFSLNGQSVVWNIITKVSSQLLTETKKFNYISPPPFLIKY